MNASVVSGAVSPTQISAVASDAPSGVAGPATAASLVPDPTPTGDIGFVIAKMIIDNAYTSRAQARQDRQRATTAMVAAQKEQVAHMREAADKRYEAAKTEAWGKIADGFLGAAGGCVTAGALGKNSNDIVRLKNEGYGNALSSGGHIVSGFASLDAASDRHAGDELDADAKAAENEATQLKRHVEGADDDMKEARDMARSALDFLREFESTRSKSLSSAIKA